jgi:hypothetical protein
MSSNRSNTKLEFVSQCQTLATGVLALPDKTLTVSEQSLTKAAVAAPLQAYVAAAAQTASDKAAYTKSVQAEKVAEAAARAMFEQLKPVLQGRFGKSNPVLETSYGIPPVKTPQKSVTVKAGAVAKAATTRAANHTMGPKQKKAAKKAPAVPPAKPTV